MGEVKQEVAGPDDAVAVFREDGHANLTRFHHVLFNAACTFHKHTTQNSVRRHYY